MPDLTYPDFRDLPQRPDLRDQLLKVESLGISCELGLVQRHCHAEPLGLFRFGLTPLAGLMDALESQFEDISNPDCISLYEGFNREWITHHRRYGFEVHTDHSKDKFSEQFVLERMSKHFRFLAKKFMEDLADGSKILFYRPMSSQPPGAEAGDLMRLLNRYGKPNLVWVSEADGDNKAGTASWAPVEGLIAGYIDRYAELTFAAGASFQSWLDLVESALKLSGRLP